MKTPQRPFWMAVFLLAGSTQIPAHCLSLKEAQARAIRQSPQIKLLQSRKQVLLAQLQKIGLRLPGDLTVEGGLGFAGDKEGLVELKVELEKSRQNHLLAQAERALGNFDLENLLLEEKILENQARLKVLKAYGEAWLSDRHLQELKKQMEGLEELSRILEIQKEKGQVAGLDLNLVKAELARDRLELKKAESLHQTRQLALALSISQGDKSPKLDTLSFSDAVPPLTALIKGLEDRSADILELKKELKRLALEEQKIRAEGKREVAGTLALGLEKPREDRTEGIISFGLTRSFSNRKKTQFLLEENRLQKEEVLQKIAARKKMLQLELSQASELAHSAREPVRILEKELLPRFRENLETLRKTWQLGHISLPDLLEQERQFMTLTLDLQASREEALQAWINLMTAAELGVTP